jgi:UDP-N-acetylglucosamine 4,6-dehydratase/5-epimerase
MLNYNKNIFKNKTILITGGTGTLGRNFIDYVTKNLPFKKIIIFSRDEQKHFKLQSIFLDKRIRFFIGDIRDYDRLDFAMKDVDFVLHSAALKHVGLSEYNPMECIKTNVFGTENVVRASINNSVSHALLVSSDKAVSPVNLYGSTKLMAEKIFINANNLIGKRDLRFSVSRYGNVAGSEGSVLQTFNKLITSGQTNLPITDPKMTRFWVDIEQCVGFVMGCFSRMQGGEIYIPKIPSIKITDLAKAFGCKYTVKGLKNMEKIDELMFNEEEARNIVEFSKFFLIKPKLEHYTGIITGKYKNISKKIVSSEYRITSMNEKGKKLKTYYNFSSKNNYFLSVEEIKKQNKSISSRIAAKKFIFL